MTVAIIGTGGVALATAALLRSGGHTATLVSLTGKGGADLSAGAITATGAINGSFPISLAASAASALGEADRVVVATSADRYSAVLDAVLPHLEDRHDILVSGELSRFSGVLRSKLDLIGRTPAIVALASTLATGRRTGAKVHVGLLRSSVLAFAAAPRGDGSAMARWNAILGDVLVACDSAARIVLSNVNPIVHAPSALCNLTRIETGEDWSNYGGITQGVARLLIALDAERLALGDALGETLTPFAEQFAKSHGFGSGVALGEMAQALDLRRGGLPKGPTDLSTRYVTEDVPFGLVVLEHLGATLGVATPVTRSFIDIFSAIYGRDFRAENPFLSELEF